MLRLLWKNIGKVGRSVTAIQAVYNSATLLSSQVLLGLLDDAVVEINVSAATLTNTFAFYIKRILESLRSRSDVTSFDIARREYAFLPLFAYQRECLTIHSLLAESPSMFVSVICDVFKPASGENREPTREAVARARSGYQLLSEFHTIPGMDSQLNIDEDKLTSWVVEVRRLARNEDRTAMADEFIGHLLAHGPTDPDGAWPHRVVSNLLQSLSSDSVESGVLIERFNMRGVTMRAPFEGGNQERVLAQEANEWSKQRRAWPRVFAMLAKLASNWESHGENEDVRARQDAMRFN